MKLNFLGKTSNDESTFLVENVNLVTQFGKSLKFLRNIFTALLKISIIEKPCITKMDKGPVIININAIKIYEDHAL